MNFIESFNNKTILIPLLQRDYVQGSSRSAVISPFLDALLEKECDLNYIYGYEENGCFVPIDGQQRLTTLWLLYLYLHAQKHESDKYNVRMEFSSREYAEDFCERLHEHLEDLLSDADNSITLDNAIKDANWFIRSWCKNATVNNMLCTLKLIHRKITPNNIDSIWNRLVKSDVPSITFAFLQMDESNGLDDDIYIKMNGRGRKLSAFENLKSWMDEKINGLAYSKEWRTGMDNEWTNMFWQNRNHSQEHPEEIDDEQLFFFYNLLILYHIKTKELKRTVEEIKENNQYVFEELQDFLYLDAKADVTDIWDKIIGKLQEADNFPLLWFDRLKLMSKGFFDFAFKSTQNIEKYANEFNSLNLYIGDTNKEETTSIYRLCMCGGTLDRTLPLFYALLSYDNGATALYDWMRVMRNLILGTTISKENVSRILISIDAYTSLCKDEDIYKLLSEGGLKINSSGFNQQQFKEEQTKASWIIEDREWTQIFEIAESTSFCRGTIGFIFNFLPEQKNKQVFKEYSTLFHLIFDNSGVRKNNKYNLQRALMCFTSHYGFGYSYGDKWKFMDSRDEWHKFLTDSNDYEGQPHNHSMKLLTSRLHELLYQFINLSVYREEYSNALNSALESIIKDTLNRNNISDWRHFFIKYSSIWDSMKKSMCRWAGEYDIFILGSSQYRNGNIRELRSFAFWQDVLADSRNNPEEYKAWQDNFHCYDDTCMFMEHKCISGRVATIDLFYKRGNPNQYRFRIFYRENEFEPHEETYYATKNDMALIAGTYNFKFNEEDHKYWSSEGYSHEDALNILKLLMENMEK